MVNRVRYILLYLLVLITTSGNHINAQNSNIEKQYYKDSIELARYKLLLSKKQYDSIGIDLSNIENADKVSSMSEYNKNLEDLRQKYDLQSLKLEDSIQNNKARKRIILCIIISLIIACTSVILLYFQNKKLKKYKEKWKVMQMSAEIALRSKSVMLSNMSHEIKTPLNALIGFSDIISDSESIDDNMLKECNEIIKLNSSLLQNLVNDVIDMSRLNIDNLRISLKTCDIIDICRKTTNTLQQIKQTDANIVFESDLPRLIIKTDPARIQQVLINLLVNATKFCKQGKITLSVERKDNMAFFFVSDTGTGIPLEKQQVVFDRFEKVNEESHGTGLGLSICKLIITELKGKIWIDPSYTQGARFIFTLPIQR